MKQPLCGATAVNNRTLVKGNKFLSNSYNKERICFSKVYFKKNGCTLLYTFVEEIKSLACEVLNYWIQEPVISFVSQ
jgi:hypothetical protein